MKRPRIFYARLWLSQRLYSLGIWIEPEYRSQHRVSEDGKSIYFWQVPA